jgi:hypothetical protein
MLVVRETAKQIRSRLFNPVNGRQSSELEIVPSDVLRRRRIALIRSRVHYPQVSSQESRQAREHGFLEMFEAQFVSLNMPGIIRIVCRYYGLDVNHLAAKQRTLLLVRPRQIVMYLAKEHTLLSLSQIATRLDRMDHTTVLYGARRIKQLMATDIRLAAEIENFERHLGCYHA